MEVEDLPEVARSSKAERARVAALGSDPALAELLAEGFDARIAAVRQGKPGFVSGDRHAIFERMSALTGAQRRALRDVLLFKPPHPQLGQMDRKDPAILGPPTAAALMQILSGALLGLHPEPGPYHRDRADRLLLAMPGTEAEREAQRAQLYAHEGLVRVVESNGPLGFTLVNTFGLDAADALLADPFHVPDLVGLVAEHPEQILAARRYHDKRGPRAFRDALEVLHDVRFEAGFRSAESMARLGFDAAVRAAEIVKADLHGARAHRALSPQESLLDIAAEGPEVLAQRLSEAGAQVVEFGARGVPLMKGTNAWPALEVPGTPKIEAAERRLLDALALGPEVLDDPASAPLADVSRVVRAMRQQIHRQDPEAAKNLSRELSGRRFISRSYYDALYAKDTGNPEHRYSKQTYDSWREGDAFVRAEAKADRGRPLTANRVLDVLSGIHQRAARGMVEVHESHLKPEDLGRVRDKTEDHVQLGDLVQHMDAGKAAILADNPYLQPADTYVGDNGVRRHVLFPAGPDVPRLMDETAAWIADNEGRMDPEALAAEAHFRLVSIHPFMDGNGRSSKLMVDYLLRRAGVEPPIWRQGKILLKRETWPDAIKEGVAFHLATVQRYYRTVVDPPPTPAGAS